LAEKANLKRQIQPKASRLVDWEVAASRRKISACCKREKTGLDAS
jgi:hypothetical protein